MLLPMEVMAAPHCLYIDDVEYAADGDVWSDYCYIMGKDITYDSQNRVMINGTLITKEGNFVFRGSDMGLQVSGIQTAGNSYYTFTPLDFTAPESLSMRVTQGHSDLAIDPCVITNTGSEGLKLSQVEITAASGWTVVNAFTDFTTADSKNKIAFTAGSHDFSNGAYTPGEKIAAGSNTTLQLAGKISEKADLMNATQVASMVLTVEKVEIISFKINSTSYQAEAGMTWREWVDSRYNTSGYIITEYVRDPSGRYLVYRESTCVEPDETIVDNQTYTHRTSGSPDID